MSLGNSALGKVALGFNEQSATIVALGQLTETSSFNALSSGKVYQLGSFVESSAFNDLVSAKSAQLGALSGVGAFSSVNARKLFQLGSVGEVASFLPLVDEVSEPAYLCRISSNKVINVSANRQTTLRSDICQY